MSYLKPLRSPVIQPRTPRSYAAGWVRAIQAYEEATSVTQATEKKLNYRTTVEHDACFWY